MDGAVVGTTLGVVGFGRMGEALVAGMLDAGVVTAGDVVIADPRAAHVAAMTERYGVRAAEDNREALGCDTVVLSVKPQVLPAVLGTDGVVVRADALVVSIAAGVTTATLDALLPNDPAIVRVMPNTPALVGAGASAVAAGPRATAEHTDRVAELLAPLGLVRTLPESSIDAVTAVSGSGPAYVFLLAEALAEAGVLVGLSRDDATALANATVAGAGAMLVDDGSGTAAELREAVTSPGGTTAAALQELERHGLRAAVLDAVVAAARRAGELGSD